MSRPGDCGGEVGGGGTRRPCAAVRVLPLLPRPGSGMVRALARKWAMRRAAECVARGDDLACFEDALAWVARHPRRARFLAVESVRASDERLALLDRLHDCRM